VSTGGTSSPPDFVPRRVLASVDPVALDARALTLTEELRDQQQLGLKPIDRTFTAWMENSQAQGLGSVDYQLRKVQ